MNFKVFGIVSGLILLAIVAFTAYFLHQAAAEAAVTRNALQAESECAAEIPKAIHMVTDRDSAKTVVTQTASHFNTMVRQCYIEIDTYQHGDSAIFTKTLISPADSGAVLWSVAGRPDSPERKCFGADTMPVDCATADKRWKAYMKE